MFGLPVHYSPHPPRKPKPSCEEAKVAAAERRRLHRDLREAAAKENFILHYQPRLALSAGRMVAAEALIRWPHRRRGLVSPAAFIPLAEETGLITPIGGWVLRAGLAEATTWPEPLIVSVNVSARQLHDGA